MNESENFISGAFSLLIKGKKATKLEKCSENGVLLDSGIAWNIIAGWNTRPF